MGGGRKADTYMYLDGEGVKGMVMTPPGPTGEGEGEGEEGGKLTHICTWMGKG